MTALQEQQQHQDGTGGDVLDESVNIRVESPDAKKLDNAELQIKAQHYSDIQEQVIEHVKKNSKEPRANRL